MSKNIEFFDLWNTNKKGIELNKCKKVYPKHREIWYISLGKNIGFESNGKGESFRRPVLVLSRIGSVYFVVSMTTKGKNNDFYYEIDDNMFDKKSFITLSQFKTIDKKRFIVKIGKVDNEIFLEIKRRIKCLF